MLKLKRDSGSVDLLRAYKVVLDGNIIGYIKNGEEREFDIAEGNHDLFLKIDWCRSNVLSFKDNANTVNFECGSSCRGWKAFLVIIYIIFLPNKYLWLKKNL
ncbi:hypothetical protein [Okeania sp.]|uniref:hypothetical protein n=1 Tax=Okeania sp. TaxID=3100323 RepID=UPI002B4B0B40|nr:hypothetical protein [Okeania sp.]MEB3343631.1 hypothetical protein [Okeania sp.]